MPKRCRVSWLKYLKINKNLILWIRKNIPTRMLLFLHDAIAIGLVGVIESPPCCTCRRDERCRNRIEGDCAPRDQYGPKISCTARLSLTSWKREPKRYSQNRSQPQTADVHPFRTASIACLWPSAGENRNRRRDDRAHRPDSPARVWLWDPPGLRPQPPPSANLKALSK